MIWQKLKKFWTFLSSGASKTKQWRVKMVAQVLNKEYMYIMEMSGMKVSM